MTIELITIGSELLSGHTLNTNAHFIGGELARVGLVLSRQVSIPDDHETIIATVREALARADWVIVSGGLGPTNDDITKKALARVFDRPLVFHDEILTELKERFARAGRAATPLLDTQALQPRGAEFIPNPVGTAVGIILTQGPKTLVAVPGVPREMQPMIIDHIVPRIAAQTNVTTVSLTWSTTGWPESRLFETLEELIKETPAVTVAFLPSERGVKLRFSATGPDARTTLENWVQTVRPRIMEALYAEDDVALEVVVGKLLRERHLTIAVAESCTGGLIAKRLTDVPRASAYVLAALVTYSNQAKIDLLGVDPQIIERHGAVSEPVARAMAEGAIARTGADCAISVTGIAGPGGGTLDKPVGLVWIGVSQKTGGTTARQFQFMGDREMIRERAAQAALNMLRVRLLTP
ncbi:MAG: competence/damage-inducible protein A [candidate division Zixibacteria bacterium]|nr:competence/damage-inducible protein A [candidate division Zixibacteria bacterium]